MKNVTCEICGAVIKTNEPNYFTLFGQRACRAWCMEELSKKRRAAGVRPARNHRHNQSMPGYPGEEEI